MHIKIDPITRIEGHLAVEVNVKSGEVFDAWTSGTMFRGIENILIGRDPRDAPTFTQRSCGVCTYSHLLCSVRAVEDAIGVNIPDNARIIRNLLHGAQLTADHIVHFYLLHGLDWVDIVSALKADPYKAAALAGNTGHEKHGSAGYYKSVKDRLQKFVDSGQLGPFNNAYWGHPAYKLSPEANIIVAANYIEALRIQANAAKLLAIFGGKAPHPDALVVGGITSVRDLTPDRIAEFKYVWEETFDFVKNAYIPDLLMVASNYKEWASYGKTANFLSWGEFPESSMEPSSLFLPRGLIMGGNLDKVEKPDPGKIAEHVDHSWYEKEPAKGPYEGETKPRPGNYDRDRSYSWIKAPRYNGQPCEVGPLARVLVSYSKGHDQMKAVVDPVLKTLGIKLENMCSTLGRTAARGLETLVIGEAMDKWINDLVTNLKKGNTDTYKPWKMPEREAHGIGLNDVARGALGHWIIIKDGKIAKYQYVVPSTWNLGPRCANNFRGPVEEALLNTPIDKPAQPVEVLRTVHSFDPCLSCAVHVIDKDSDSTFKVRVL